ncbi:hypothetical protein V2J09_010175, partial [Rumex salicifolius]
KLNTSVEALEDDFKIIWNPEKGEYSRKFVEYFSTKALKETCGSIGEPIAGVSFSRFTFDIMLAWQIPSSIEEQSHTESSGKEKEDRQVMAAAEQENEDVSIFYSDIMPLLVDHEPGVQEDSFVWFASLFPLCGDVVNARSTFETLTSTTAYRLHFPAYDKFLKEIEKCVQYLQKQETPTGVELASDEIILHVEGTTGSQRVVRHISGSSWPGRLTLTSHALYFEASGTATYEGALKIDLSRNTEQSLKSIATGPWGAMLFDKAIKYQCSEMSEDLVLEFPEMTSSTRRDHWLALTKEIILLHQFLSKNNLEGSVEGREMQSRTVLAIIRLHAVREMLRMAPPVPKSFLIFTLLEELPKGDYILEELAVSLRQLATDQPCSASLILRSLRASSEDVSHDDVAKGLKEEDDASTNVAEKISSLDNAIMEAREQEEEIEIAKATTESVKEEGIGDSVQVLVELLKPLKSGLLWFQKVVKWERPDVTVSFLAAVLLVTYKEWVGLAMAACLLWAIVEILHARKRRIKEKYNKVVVYTASEKSSMENIVSAQQGLRNTHDLVQNANIALLKIQSLLVSRVEKTLVETMFSLQQTNVAIMATVGVAIVLVLVPFKYILMAAILSIFIVTSKLGKITDSTRGNRRLKEWWESIPVVPVEIVDELTQTPT